MNYSLKNPEMRQLQDKKVFYRDNCRPSGLKWENQRELESSTRRRLFNIKTNAIPKSNGATRRWIVISSGKRSVLVRYLFLKFLYDELTENEYKLLLSLDESTNSIPIFYALRARRQGIPKKIIRKILELISLKDFKVPTREEYLSLKQIQFSLKEKTYPSTRKLKPYSGYSKGYKDGKRKSKLQVDESFGSSPLEPRPNFEDEIKALIDFSLKVLSHPRVFLSLKQMKGSNDGF